MKTLVLVMLCPVCSVVYCHAQAEENAVKAVVEKLFKGMQLGDSAMVRSTFQQQVTLATAFTGRDGNPVLRRESSIDDFLKAVGTPHAEPWNEEIWDVEVKIDGSFAQVWCAYAFYVGNKFSHCGIDAFHLHKGNAGWKIFHLADTRRPDPCNIPQSIADKYKTR